LPPFKSIVYALSSDVNKPLQPGIFPRAERLVLLFIALALVPYFPLASSYFLVALWRDFCKCASWRISILFAGAVLSMITFAQRFWYFAA